jgi:type IV pilus assembly protein PilN
VVLTSLKQEGDVLILEGRTQSNARVSTYMRNLESSGWMTNPELTIIEAKAQEGSQAGAVVDIKALPYMFELKVTLPNPTSEELGADALAAAGMEEVATEAGGQPADASDGTQPAGTEVPPAADAATPAPAADAAQPVTGQANTGAAS